MKTYKQFLEDMGVAVMPSTPTNIVAGIAGVKEPPVSKKAQELITKRKKLLKRNPPKM